MVSKYQLLEATIVHIIALIFQDQFRHIKSAPSNSLTYKLALCVACVNDEFEGLRD